MARTMTFHLFLLSLVTMISVIPVPCFPAASNGFSTELIHRDSRNSPFYDPSLTPSQRLGNILQRSFNRVYHTPGDISPRNPFSEMVSASGEYLVKLAIGTPPVPTLVFMDTGSSLLWVQCQPCQYCYKQMLPIFMPSTSSSYKLFPCYSPLCAEFEGSFCGVSREICTYTQNYADGSMSRGCLAKETITFESRRVPNGTLSFRNITIGCGNNNDIVFGFGASAGIAGFGSGKVSLISQLLNQVKGKFSYCLVPHFSSASGKLNFAGNAVVSGLGAVSTPIYTNPLSPFYYLKLEGVSVGRTKLAFVDDLPDDSMEGNIATDSGALMTLLPLGLYVMLEKEVARQMNLERTQDPKGLLSLCYLMKNDMKLPDLTFHFESADLRLKELNSFLKITNDVLCLAFGVSHRKPAVFGNLAQQNFLVGFDLVKKIVSFKAKDCTKE